MNLDASNAGRSCPLHYRYPPESFRTDPAPGFDDLEVLYVVGGLYGNEPALLEVVRLFALETGRKRLVFNGDFHWFDAEPEWFSRIQTGVLQFDATRGNVETELADEDSGSEVGCGCAYPDWVDDDTVQRSNRILQSLRTCVTNGQRAALAALPMWLRANVGGMRIGIVHGDATSLSGWGFARENLQTAEQRTSLQNWFDAAQLDGFASSHTCAPVFAQIPDKLGARWVLNNGAAGMPNLQGDSCGLLTRIAVQPFQGEALRFAAQCGAVQLEAIAISLDPSSWISQFQQRWSHGSDAHASYYERITQGDHCELPCTIALEN
ncbi:MAG: hypothetical protein H7Y28_12230 [Rhodoferax sp.]|nr:hypothetical protein [Rhodoferax sp.]